MDEKEKNLTQNEPVRPTEAPEGQEQAEAVSQGGVKTEVAQEPSSEATEATHEEVTAPRGRETIMLDEELVTPEPATTTTEAAPVVEKRAMTEVVGPKPAKKSHKGLIITIIVTVVLAIGAGVAWWFMAGPGKTENQEVDEVVSDEKRPSSGDGSSRPISTKPNYGDGSTSVDVDLDGLEFHSVFDGFANSMLVRQWLSSQMWYSSLLPSLPDGKVIAGDITDEIAFSWAIDSTPGYDCGALVEKLRPLALQQVESSLNRVITNPSSVSNEQREQIKRDFEDMINSESFTRYETCYTGESLRTRVWEMFDRDVELKNGDMIISGIFGSQHMYAAELDVFYPWPFQGGGNGPRPIHIPYAAEKDSERMYVKTAEVLCYKEYTGEDCDADFVKNHSDEVEARYNWILKKASDGRYVFESVEKVK